ncbi:Fe-S protein assembly co-chaperone HscB [Methylobacillus caricis]|uniref:Fe-S protein assembly co-chaperone HscB n=1 Tax=Methylobacillus caricis TaxID=1971611 RepID=UPI001CFF950E|nr:Fe-S protein assembly co-chaperone HscB [Methylobacillus caricis]MCB5186932.1 Fe-S protein assembly co-chaperone HscB [Methylobacillus caricis]
MSDFLKNHFELLGLAPRFEINNAELDQSYRKIQAEVHPDKFVAGTSTERMQSMQWATQANEAYRTLKNPTARARYLLHLQGVDTEEENNTAMPAEFLMLQMEWREKTEEASHDKDIGALDAMLKEMLSKSAELQADLQTALDQEQAWQTAAEIVRKLSFIDKIRYDVEHEITKLED